MYEIVTFYPDVQLLFRENEKKLFKKSNWNIF